MAIKLLDLRVFVAAYQEGSFSAAAERLNATQSGLSMRIRDVEARYGVTLFDRSSAGVVPTEHGVRLYRKAVEVLRAADEAEKELQRVRGALSGHVTCGLVPTFTRSIGSAALLRMHEQHPLVNVYIHEAYSPHLTDMTKSGELDLAIVPAGEEDIKLRTSFLRTDREYLVRSRGSGPKDGEPVSLKTLPPQKFIVPTPANARRSRIEHYLADNGIQPAARFEYDSMIGTFEMITRSDWVAIIPGILARDDAASRQRWIHPLDSPALTCRYVMIEPVARNLSEAASAFLGILKEELDRALAGNPAD